MPTITEKPLIKHTKAELVAMVEELRSQPAPEAQPVFIGGLTGYKLVNPADVNKALQVWGDIRTQLLEEAGIASAKTADVDENRIPKEVIDGLTKRQKAWRNRYSKGLALLKTFGVELPEKPTKG